MDQKPVLNCEKVWGSRAYVTIPPENNKIGKSEKLHKPRGWLGYFVGCETESIYRIWHPEYNKVYRVTAARIDDGENNDPHDQPSLSARSPNPTLYGELVLQELSETAPEDHDSTSQEFNDDNDHDTQNENEGSFRDGSTDDTPEETEEDAEDNIERLETSNE